MMRRLLDKAGKVKAIEYTLEEISQLLDCAPERLSEWQQLIPPSGTDEAGNPLYQLSSSKDLELWKKRIALLATGMGETSVSQVEEAGQLNAYAALAEDAPEGITAHIWRSYALVVLMQAKHNLTLTPDELARRAGLVDYTDDGKPVLGVETANKHLRFLTNLGYLKLIKPGVTIRINDRNEKATEMQWLHKGLPKAWQKD